jgi:hypothetical protein
VASHWGERKGLRSSTAQSAAPNAHRAIGSTGDRSRGGSGGWDMWYSSSLLYHVNSSVSNEGIVVAKYIICVKWRNCHSFFLRGMSIRVGRGKIGNDDAPA